MKCPFCANPSSNVSEVDARATEDRISRVRECDGCHRQFHTSERLDERDLLAEKRDGSVEPFQRHKIAEGIRRSARSDVISEAAISEIVDRVVGEIYRRGNGSPNVTTRAIGELVMEELRACSEAAHIRYAIVFRGRVDSSQPVQPLETLDDLLTWVTKVYGIDAPPVIELSDQPRHVVKRSGRVQLWQRQKLARGILTAVRGRRATRTEEAEFAEKVVDEVTERLALQPIVTSGQISTAVMDILEKAEPVAYIRFAILAKQLSHAYEVWAEASALARRRHQTPSSN